MNSTDIKTGDLVEVFDWSYSLNCNNQAHRHTGYMRRWGDGEKNKWWKYIGVFKVIGIGDFPTGKSVVDSVCVPTNNLMIENIYTKEIFFTQFVRKTTKLFLKKFSLNGVGH